jgi:hypothetical protein
MMSLTSTWWLVGSHSESSLSPHNDRLMVTYQRGLLVPFLHRARSRIPESAARTPSGFDLATMWHTYGRDGSSRESRVCRAASTGNHVFSASSSVSAHST